MKRLENKMAIVTGASQGIGRAIALAFGREGASIVLTARSEDTTRKTRSRGLMAGRITW